MALQEHTRRGQNLTKKNVKSEPKTEYKRRPLPMWCRGIMSGCVNCGGCI